jgi:hypothetical protein
MCGRNTSGRPSKILGNSISMRTFSIVLEFCLTIWKSPENGMKSLFLFCELSYISTDFKELLRFETIFFIFKL